MTNECIWTELPAGLRPESTQTRLCCHCDAEKDSLLPEKSHTASEIFISSDAPMVHSHTQAQTTSEGDVLHLQDKGSSSCVDDHLTAAHAGPPTLLTFQNNSVKCSNSRSKSSWLNLEGFNTCHTVTHHQSGYQLDSVDNQVHRSNQSNSSEH